LRCYLDTSVLVAALVESHPDHRTALASLRGRPKAAIATSTHGLAETWATLTRLPLAIPLAPRVALEVIRRLERRITVLALARSDYRAALERSSSRGLRSGVVFDALHLEAALRWKAGALFTFNRGDFDRLIDGDGALAIQSPG